MLLSISWFRRHIFPVPGCREHCNDMCMSNAGFHRYHCNSHTVPVSDHDLHHTGPYISALSYRCHQCHIPDVSGCCWHRIEPRMSGLEFHRRCRRDTPV